MEIIMSIRTYLRQRKLDRAARRVAAIAKTYRETPSHLWSPSLQVQLDREATRAMSEAVLFATRY